MKTDYFVTKFPYFDYYINIFCNFAPHLQTNTNNEQPETTYLYNSCHIRTLG